MSTLQLRLSPQAQQICAVHTIAGDRRVVGDAFHDLLGSPTHAIPALTVVVRLGAPAELHIAGDFRAHDFPGIAESQPLIRDLDLPAVADRLIEDSELVADAVADRRNVQLFPLSEECRSARFICRAAPLTSASEIKSSPPAHRPHHSRIFPRQENLLRFVADHKTFALA